MNRDEATQALAAVESDLYDRIPTDAPSWGRRHLRYVVEEHLAAARFHLALIYDAGCALGPGLTPLPAHAAHPKYGFWAEGVQRHLEICAASLDDDPSHDPGLD